MKIQTHNICMAYRDGAEQKTVLEGVNISLDSEKPNIIIGPSGSGKSTLLYLIALLRHPTSGSVVYSDVTDNQGLSPEELRFRHIGFVFQQAYLIPYLNAVENICLCRKNTELKSTAFELLEKFGLSYLSAKKPFQMSGGERQRIAIIRALLNNPEVIIADEPTSSLDRDNARGVFDILRDVSKGKILIVATHDISLLHGDERILSIENRSVNVQR